MLNWTLIGAVGFPHGGGFASALTMIGQVRRKERLSWYYSIKKPTWTPPNWVFGRAWTILYTCMGIASYLVYKECGFAERGLLPFALYGIQLAFNFTWTPIFFRLHKIGWALSHMLILDVLTIACTYSFYQVNTNSALLMVPYLAWLSFGSYLNYTIWWMNKNKSIEIN